MRTEAKDVHDHPGAANVVAVATAWSRMLASPSPASPRPTSSAHAAPPPPNLLRSGLTLLGLQDGRGEEFGGERGGEGASVEERAKPCRLRYRSPSSSRQHRRYSPSSSHQSLW
uniref:Uncharacterized protein n=1 Tax=Oryza sativa subsp. japonica TaxID=39947 RepID=Q6ZAB8_ORYSJ|nr:hypothetical protein [Oryza sativa Japonica Group]BAD09804.1 hypothetical protein [Oryza sativa Japonica Group]